MNKHLVEPVLDFRSSAMRYHAHRSSRSVPNVRSKCFSSGSDSLLRHRDSCIGSGALALSSVSFLKSCSRICSVLRHTSLRAIRSLCDRKRLVFAGSYPVRMTRFSKIGQMPYDLYASKRLVNSRCLVSEYLAHDLICTASLFFEMTVFLARTGTRVRSRKIVSLSAEIQNQAEGTCTLFVLEPTSYAAKCFTRGCEKVGMPRA